MSGVITHEQAVAVLRLRAGRRQRRLALARRIERDLTLVPSAR